MTTVGMTTVAMTTVAMTQRTSPLSRFLHD